MFSGIIKSIGETAREFAELERLFSDENKVLRQLVFYGESPIQYRYYEDFIDHILKNSDYEICYLASDLDDPLFQNAEARIKPFFIKNTLKTAFARLDSKVLVIANPDLGTGAIQRAPDPVHHVLAFRGICSTHQGYRLGAFDHYDSMLCIAPYQIAELRKTEEIYGLKPKSLPLVGYPLLDRIYREHQKFEASFVKPAGEKTICLVAPTWDPFQKASIFNNGTCAENLIDELAKTQLEVWIRPHPEFAKRYPKRLEQIARHAQKTTNTTLQMRLGSMESLHRADVLITDQSTISMDYALGTERAVIFINTPSRIDNPEFEKVGMEPVENSFRKEIGTAINLDQINTLPAVLAQIFADKEQFKKKIPALRDQLVANWQHSAAVGGDYILQLLKN